MSNYKKTKAQAKITTHSKLPYKSLLQMPFNFSFILADFLILDYTVRTVFFKRTEIQADIINIKVEVVDDVDQLKYFQIMLI